MLNFSFLIANECQRRQILRHITTTECRQVTDQFILGFWSILKANTSRLFPFAVINSFSHNPVLIGGFTFPQKSTRFDIQPVDAA